MGRSNGGVNNGNANNGGAGNSSVNKVVAGAAALVVALVCYVFGIQPSSGGSASSSNNTQVTASQTVSGTESSAGSGAGSDDSSSTGSAAESSASEAVGTLTFRNEERLQEHYEKHGIDMGFSSAEAYLAGANKVISDPSALHKTEAKDGDDAYYLEDTGEFVVVSQAGYIRTYFLASKDYFERQ